MKLSFEKTESPDVFDTNVVPICKETGEGIEEVVACTVESSSGKFTRMTLICNLFTHTDEKKQSGLTGKAGAKVASRVFKHKTTYDYGCAHDWLNVTTRRDHETGVRRCTCTACGATKVIKFSEQEG